MWMLVMVICSRLSSMADRCERNDHAKPLPSDAADAPAAPLLPGRESLIRSLAASSACLAAWALQAAMRKVSSPGAS